jgi:molybdate transport system substrate-binding protein
MSRRAAFRPVRRAVAAILALVTAMLTACTGGGPPVPAGVLTIFAPPSMADAVSAMARAYSGSYPGVRFETVFEPDTVLAQRASQEPGPDLLMAEDPATLIAAGITGTPTHFARGQLVLAVPTANPARINEIADLARPGVRVALCDSSQPCGRVAEALLTTAQVTLTEGAMREMDVRSALRHVTDGTADVALVYRSDALAAPEGIIAIEVPASGMALADFVAIVPDDAPNRGVAQAFLDYLAGAPVRDALTRDGFRPPA